MPAFFFFHLKFNMNVYASKLPTCRRPLSVLLVELDRFTSTSKSNEVKAASATEVIIMHASIYDLLLCKNTLS